MQASVTATDLQFFPRRQRGQEFSRVRRDIISRVVGKQFIAYSAQRHAVIDIVAGRQQTDFKVESLSALFGLFQDVLATPIDSLEQPSMISFQADQIISAVV